MYPLARYFQIECNFSVLIDRDDICDNDLSLEYMAYKYLYVLIIVIFVIEINIKY